MNTTVLAERYRLTNHLARGGMADVYSAIDEVLGRKVAVKMLHANYATDDAFIQRFRREAQAAANLTHPNIVSIFDTGKDGGHYFIVMELVEGKTLRDVLRAEGTLASPPGRRDRQRGSSRPRRSPPGADWPTATSSRATSF